MKTAPGIRVSRKPITNNTDLILASRKMLYFMLCAVISDKTVPKCHIKAAKEHRKARMITIAFVTEKDGTGERSRSVPEENIT